MTRHEIAIKKPLLEVFLRKDVAVSRRVVVLKKWWPVILEKSPCSATCKECRGIIPAKTARFKVWITVNPWKKFYMASLYHEGCLPNEILEIIKKKEK